MKTHTNNEENANIFENKQILLSRSKTRDNISQRTVKVRVDKSLLLLLYTLKKRQILAFLPNNLGP